MSTIITELRLELESKEAGESICFEVLNPDIQNSIYAGNLLQFEGKAYLYRGYKAWTDLAQILFCKIQTPQIVNKHIIQLCFVKLNTQESFHTDVKSEEKYGVDSKFFQISKLEEPSFIDAYTKALQAVKVTTKKQILNLGINTGDEFEAIRLMLSEEVFNSIEFRGVDHSLSAIDLAKKRFPTNNMQFFAHDINALDDLNLERSDLIISIGTLQSPSINFKLFFMSLVQNYLTKEGAIILGFPNCRWMDGEMVYGAKAANYSYSEMSVVIKDIYYCKKYLQQHKFRVTVTGKDYLFLTATSIR